MVATVNLHDTRVVVTGTGVISPVGNSVGGAWDSVLEGRSGIGPITTFDASGFRTHFAGEVKEFDITEFISAKEARRLDPFCHYAIGATSEAVKTSGLDLQAIDNHRVGVFVGSGIGGIRTFEQQCDCYATGGPARVSPFLIPMFISDMASGMIAILYDLRGPNFSIVSACATGSHAIGEAWWVIKRGDADVMITGGSEACLAPTGLAGFCKMKALSERNDDPQTASRPFDADRDGFVMAEGAGVLVIESLEHATRRGATILAEIIGYAASADAYHMTAPRPDADGAAAAIRGALERAKIAPADVHYINAHGTSTPFNDKFETMAIKSVFGDCAGSIPVSSTKALTGHTLGAAGGIETIFCIQALNHSTVPGTFNLHTADPDCDLDYIPNESRATQVKVALNMNFGFGGHNAILVIKKFEG